MNNVIGRQNEVNELKDLYLSNRSEFVAIYGRRRVGKTFLVDSVFAGKITFRHAGLRPFLSVVFAFRGRPEGYGP